MRAILSGLIGAGVMAASACSLTTDTSEGEPLLDAFQAAPFGMSNVTSTFALSSDQEGTPWAPRGRPGHEFGPRGYKGGPMGFLMGGLGGAFLGNGFGPGFGHRPPSESDPSTNCAFDSGSGWLICDPIERNGLTIMKSAQFLDTGGNVQPAFNGQTTNTVNTRITVTGTRTRGDGSATSEVDHESDRSVSGLAPGSTERTVNGTSRGHEVITGTDRTGDFVADRLAGDTIQNVVIPVPSDGRPPLPVSGQIIRSMRVTITYAGSDPVTRSRREVITFGPDGITIEITHNGVTRTCTLTLPQARPQCS